MPSFSCVIVTEEPSQLETSSEQPLTKVSFLWSRLAAFMLGSS